MSELVDYISAGILGIVQGLTEFLPVSSSGHLVVFEHFFPIEGDSITFDLILHLGTLIPVVWIYREDIKSILVDLSSTSSQVPWFEREGCRLASFVILGSIPTGILGILCKDFFESIFHDPQIVSIPFAITGCILFALRYVKSGELNISNMQWWQAVLIGLIQGIAITRFLVLVQPLQLLFLLGINRTLAAKFSFLLSIPTIVGLCILQVKDAQMDFDISMIVIGFLSATISGYLALQWLLELVNTGNFTHFCWYLWTIACNRSLGSPFDITLLGSV